MSLAIVQSCSVELSLKPNLHSRISLVACEIFVFENYNNDLNVKFLHLVSEMVVSGGHLPKQLSLKGF